MIDDKQRHILEAVVQVLKVAGVVPWFEARIIKDSDKKLNGKRISSRTKTDLASVLAVADKRRVGMLPNMRMELRMYATLAGSRSVFMGQELTGTTAATVIPDEVAPLVMGVDLGSPDGDSMVVARRNDDGTLTILEPKDPTQEPQEPVYLEGRANYSPAKNVERLRAEGLAEDHPLMRQAKRKVERVLRANDIDPKDPYVSDSINAAQNRIYSVPVPPSPGISGSSVLAVDADGKIQSKVVVDEKPITFPKAEDTDYARVAHMIVHGRVMSDAESRAAIDNLIQKPIVAAMAKDFDTVMRDTFHALHPDQPLTHAILVDSAGDTHKIPLHTCDANGPMRQRTSDGPFLTTCSICGDFHAGSI